MKNKTLTIVRKVMAIAMAFALITSWLPVLGAKVVQAADVVCTPNDVITVVSSTSTQALYEGSVTTAIEPHPVWATIDGATWIWGGALDGEGSSPVESQTFSENFEIPVGSTPLDSSIVIAADNTYSISVNNEPLTTTGSISGNHYNPTETWVIPANMLVPGTNVLTFTAVNAPKPDGYTGPNPGGLIFKASINSQTCVVPPADVTVTIVKYVDGARATAVSADNASFSMTANYHASNLNGGVAGTGNYELDADGYNGNPAPYQAITSDMASGADYSTNENGVASVCTSETPFALKGYKIGDSEVDAQAATTTSDAVLTNITTNKYILVMNEDCSLVGPTLPVHISPMNGEATTTASLAYIDWTDSDSIHGPVTYTYQVAYDPAQNPDGSLTNAFITTPNIAESRVASPGAPEAVYYWHVRATDSLGNNSAWTAPWKLIVDNSNPTLPVHLSPADGSELKSADANLLDWSDSTDTSSVTYIYEGSTGTSTNPDGSFTSYVYQSGPLTDSQIPTPNTPDGTYYWHVKAVDQLGNTSGWTSPWKIVVDSAAPTLPFHLYPADGISTTTVGQTFIDWTDSTDNNNSFPVKYFYESSNSDATTTQGLFQFPLYTSGALATSTIDTPNTPEGTYFWHVRAEDKAGNSSAWTNAWKIIVSNATSTATSTTPTETATTTATSTIIVRPSNTQGWSTADTRVGGAVTFIADATTPAGTAALKLTTDETTAAKAQYMHLADVLLASTTDLSYYTKQNSASFEGGLPSYQLIAYLTGTSTGFTTLVYEPYQSQSSTTVATSTWQQWDVDSGLFWSSRTVVCQDGTITGAAGGPASYTLAQIRAMCPNATIGGFGVNIGTFNPSYDVETDLFNFNGTTYDFELDVATTTPETQDNTGGGGGIVPDPQLNPQGATAVSGGGSSGGSTQGSVLGASTDDSAPACESDKLVTSFLKFGWKNDVKQVKNLQSFLNTQDLGVTLPVTGFFERTTEGLVKAFQVKFANQILAPWVNAGLYPTLTVGTGYVYKTTQRWINLTICSNLNTPVPQLP